MQNSRSLKLISLCKQDQCDGPENNNYDLSLSQNSVTPPSLTGIPSETFIIDDSKPGTSHGQQSASHEDLILDSDDSVADPCYSPVEDLNASASSEDDQPSVVNRQTVTTQNKTPVKKNRSIRKRGKKTIKGDTRSVRLNRKTKRNLGESYKTAKGREVSARECKPLSACRMQCQRRFGDAVRKTIFKEYWSMGSHSKRVQYIASLINSTEKKVCKKKIVDESKQKNRSITYTYHLRVDGKMMPICKNCFLKTFNESNTFVTNVLQRKRHSISGITQDDKRGSHVAWHKVPEDVKEAAYQHLLSLPAYESHYCRKDTAKKYLPPNYTLAKIYDEYVKQETTYVPISRKLYEDMFHELKLSIKKPKKDTCQNCDKLNMQIQNSPESEKGNLQQQLESHQKEADFAYKSKSNDKESCRNDSTKRLYTFDLQQCLPTPELCTSVAFYKRQLWTFNLTIHDCVSNQAYCHMWHEGVGGRGANQVGSCLYKHLLALPENVRHVLLYSDTCGGQNKNSHIVAMFFTLLQNSNYLEVIDHKFLVPGHTHMECDADHSLIERTRKKCGTPIHHPYDWMQLVRQTGKSHPFIVVEMKTGDFHDYANLFKSSLQQNKVNDLGEKFLWKEVKWIRYDKQHFGVLQYKTTLCPSTPFKTISWVRRSRAATVLNPPLCYEGPVPIATKKKQNLLELLPYISDVFHDFYKNLVTEDVPDVYPDASDDEDV